MDLETQADHITHEPWQHCVRVNNSSPLSVGSSTGQRLERSSLTYACCRDPGGITEYCDHQNTVGYSMFPLLERERACAHSYISHGNFTHGCLLVFPIHGCCPGLVTPTSCVNTHAILTAALKHDQFRGSYP